MQLLYFDSLQTISVILAALILLIVEITKSCEFSVMRNHSEHISLISVTSLNNEKYLLQLLLYVGLPFFSFFVLELFVATLSFCVGGGRLAPTCL